MSIETNTVIHNPNTPVTQHEGMAAILYGPHLQNGQEVLDVAAGRTDLQGDLAAIGLDVHVTAVDPIYETQNFGGKSERVAGYAQQLEFKDESFDISVCTYGMQHLNADGKASAIREMIRVTRTAANYNDGSKGIIFITPIFSSYKSLRALRARGIGLEDCGIMASNADDGIIATKKGVRPTLYIHKTEALTEEKIATIIDTVGTSEALNPAHRKLGEIVSRAFGGRSHV